MWGAAKSKLPVYEAHERPVAVFGSGCPVLLGTQPVFIQGLNTFSRSVAELCDEHSHPALYSPYVFGMVFRRPPFCPSRELSERHPAVTHIRRQLLPRPEFAFSFRNQQVA
jgi:hypothetical protein